jgi:hypothetical protein
MVQRHVAALDPFRRESTERGEVRGEPDRGRDLGELGRRAHTEELDRE